MIFKNKLLSTVLVLGILGSTACTPKPINLTPAAQVAFTADQIVTRVNELENAAIAANGNGGLDDKTTAIIVKFAVSVDQTLAATPTGWQTTVVTAWKAVKAAIPNPPVTVSTVFAAVDAALKTLGVQ